MKKKILYISNVPWDTLYGAGSSLRLHFQALEKNFKKNNISADVICRYGLKEFFIKKKKSFSNIPKFLKIHKIVFYLDKIDEIVNFEFKNKKNFFLKFRKKISDFFNLITEIFFYIKIYNMNKKNNYDFIHCNSVLTIGFLNRLKKFHILNEVTTILHVRELLINPLPIGYKKEINQINKFICINDDTKNALNVALPKKKKLDIEVINNPFSPGIIKISKKIDDKLKNNITYFAIVGVVTEGKGIEFVINTFLKAKLLRSKLLVVGKGSDFKKMTEKFKKNYNIKFLGEIEDLGLTNFYEKIDFLIRGDKTTGIGRTVFEGLYSGARVILPKHRNDKLDRYLKSFKNQIKFYKPRSEIELVRLLKSTKHVKERINRKNQNNFKYYSSNMINIYSNL
tara:strand:- start:11157 stop:12344 length:1188 start_codon:yes stop_codon:yes gene_type:complete